MMVISILFLSLFSHGQSMEDKKEIQKSLEQYVLAYDSQDMKKVKEVVTPHFLSVTGGEKAWLKRFKHGQPKTVLQEIKNLKIATRNNKVYVRFDTGEKMSVGDWFLLTKDKSTWKIHELVNDFDP